MPINETPISHNLAHIYWIGGSPCSGKSAIADAFVKKYGFVLYHCDQAYYKYCKLITAEQQPTFHRLIHLSSEELWMRPVPQQVAEEIAFYLSLAMPLLKMLTVCF